MNISATIKTSAVNIVNISVDGSRYNIVYVDAAKNLNILQGNIPFDITAPFGTAAIINFATSAGIIS